ncbi:hypothetical protein BCR36DRAFT_362458 [Piromyces finnis]|uniref:DH domain-containing protein n=1 Tax=Piromyces finnis TaxID=1754191 RepID=A0A1Y1UWL1_9FUNG|nr:hypothetical protein BCR36DRAFT_362458 [Piromyces finnis]|eukprot:ORX42473.1 hypothetical protein BCR36DRAFT_362458 [Piromyces finnis]
METEKDMSKNMILGENIESKGSNDLESYISQNSYKPVNRKYITIDISEPYHKPSLYSTFSVSMRKSQESQINDSLIDFETINSEHEDETIYSGIISGYGPVIATLKYFDNNQYCLCNIKTTLISKNFTVSYEKCQQYTSFIEKKYLNDKKVVYLFSSLYQFLENDYFPLSKTVTNLHIPAKLFYEKSIVNEVYLIINQLVNISQKNHNRNMDILRTIKKIENKRLYFPPLIVDVLTKNRYINGYSVPSPSLISLKKYLGEPISDLKWPFEEKKDYKLREIVYGSKLKEIERNACLDEILTTEENYVMKLKWLKEGYYDELHKDPSQAGLKLYVVKLFLSESILKILEVNSEFLNDLKVAINNKSIKDTCQVMLDHIKNFYVYESYTKGYESFIQNAKIMAARNEKFKDFLEEKKYDLSSPFAKTNPIGLVELLAEPLQRLTRYDLLWRELIKNSTKNDPDIQILTQTLHSIYELVTRMELNINTEPQEEKTLRFFLKIANHPPTLNRPSVIYYGSINCIESFDINDAKKFNNIDIKLNNSQEIVMHFFSEYIMVTLPEVTSDQKKNKKKTFKEKKLKFLYYINIKDIEYIQERENSIKFIIKGNSHLYDNEEEEVENINYSMLKYKFEERWKQTPIVQFLNHLLVIEKSRLSFSGFEQETRKNSISKPKTSHDIGDIKNKEKKLYHLGLNNTNIYFRLVPLKGENMNSNNIQSKIGLIFDDTEQFSINELKIFFRNKAIIGLIKPTKDGHFIWSFYKNEEYNIDCDQDSIISNNGSIDNLNVNLIDIISTVDNPSELNTIYSIILSLEMKLRNSKAYQEIQQINNIFYMQKLCRLLVMEKPRSIFQESIFSFKMKNKKMGRPDSVIDSITGYSMTYSVTSRRKSITGSLLKEKSATCNKYLSSGNSYFEVNTLNSSKLRGISSWGATLRRNITFTNKPSIASEVVFLNTFTSIISIIEKKCNEIIDVEINENDIKQREMESLVKKIYSGKSINEKNVNFSQLWLIFKSLIYEAEIISQSRIKLLQESKNHKERLSVILTIPDDKMAILRKIIQLSEKITENESINKFDLDKISKELCPCLFHQDEKYNRNLFGYLLGKTNNIPKERSPFLNPNIQNNVFQELIKYSEVIMSGDIMKLEDEEIIDERKNIIKEEITKDIIDNEEMADNEISGKKITIKEITNTEIINEKMIPMHSILKTVKEIPDEFEENINNNEIKTNTDLERENSKRSKRSIEKKNVFINEDNNNYIEDVFYNTTPINSDLEIYGDSHYYESVKTYNNELYPKRYVSDSDISHANDITKINYIDSEIVDSNKTLIETNEINCPKECNYLKLDFETTKDSIFDDMKNILTTSWENK